jgi:hypothetical protein
MLLQLRLVDCEVTANTANQVALAATAAKIAVDRQLRRGSVKHATTRRIAPMTANPVSYQVAESGTVLLSARPNKITPEKTIATAVTSQAFQGNDAVMRRTTNAKLRRVPTVHVVPSHQRNSASPWGSRYQPGGATDTLEVSAHKISESSPGATSPQDLHLLTTSRARMPDDAEQCGSYGTEAGVLTGVVGPIGVTESGGPGTALTTPFSR